MCAKTRKLLMDRLEQAKTKVREAEKIIQEQTPIIKVLEGLLEETKGLEEDGQLQWTDVALELLSVEMKKNELLEVLEVKGFTLTSNKLGVWLHRQKERGILEKPSHGRYKKSQTSE